MRVILTAISYSYFVKVQHRMHPVIGNLVSELNYDHALQSHPMTNDRVIATPFPHYDSAFPITVWDLPYPESRGGRDNLSTTNKQQVFR